MNECLNLKSGEWVQVRTREEILSTLDKNGQLDQLPFMPSMFQYCGKRMRVYKTAHKTCDTVTLTGGREMRNAVHLEGSRCDGSGYGGCQAGCLIFWKEAWLKRVDGAADAAPPRNSSTENRSASGCTEEDVIAGTRVPGTDAEPIYRCQATDLPKFTTPLPMTRFSQYIDDYRSGNVGLASMLRGFIYAGYYWLSEAGIGAGAFMRWAYDRFQSIYGGIPFPRRRGTIPAGQKTPTGTLDLQPGELVRVKGYQEILATLDTRNRNRGLLFDAEMVPFCGGQYRVLRRVSRIIDEKTGKMLEFKNDCIMLQDVVCGSRYTECKYTPLFCPRAIYSYWREIWLERVEEPVRTEKADPPRSSELVGAVQK